jgi:hypothetical protein
MKRKYLEKQPSNEFYQNEDVSFEIPVLFVSSLPAIQFFLDLLKCNKIARI